MGKISKIVNRATTNAYNYSVRKRNEIIQERNRKKEIEDSIKEQERTEYNLAYRKGRVIKARREGIQAGLKSNKGSGLLGYAEGFAKAGEEMFGLSAVPKTKGNSNDLHWEMAGVKPRRTPSQPRRHKKRRR